MAYNADHTWFQVLVDQIQPPGNHEVIFDSADLPAGEYTARLQIGKRVYYEKMTKLKKWEIAENSVSEKN